MRVVVLDAMNVGHVFFHGMGELDYHGRQTGVIFGFLNKVLQLAEHFKTNRFIFAWDSHQSLRKRIYPPYKDNHPKGIPVIRGEAEVQDYKALHEQMAELYTTVLTRLGFVNVIRWTGLEADDVIAGVIKHGQIHKAYYYPGMLPKCELIDWIIVSTDRDLYQLLAPNVSMYHTSKKEMFTYTDFISFYGIEPEQWVEAKAIGGCYSDNIAGISGIADPAKSDKSRALKILRGEVKQGHYVDKINSELGQFIIERNRGLVKLPFPDVFKQPVILPDLFDRVGFIDLFDELGFNSFLKPERWAKWEAYFELVEKS